MTISIPVPYWALSKLKECGYNEEQIKTLFCLFIDQVINDGYGQCATDFDNWLNSDDFEDVCEYANIEAK